MAQKTPLYELHLGQNARIVEFSGWDLPVQFDGVLSEHRHCRSAVAVFDTGHMGVFRFDAADAAESLGRALTQNAAALKVGRCRYGFLLNDRGGVIDDCILTRPDAERLALVVNAGTRAKDADWLRSVLGGGVDFVDLVNEGWGKIDVQGPGAFRVLGPLVEAPLREMKYFGVAPCRVEGADAFVMRTGYTGELGYEVIAPAAALRGLYAKLLSNADVKPAGLGARDSLRLEMGYPLYGHELSEERTPIEADAETFLRFDHEFVGADALRAVAERGPARRLVAFKSETRRRCEPGDALLDDSGAAVGEVTSGAFCPSLEAMAGMGYVDAALARPEQKLRVKTARTEIPVAVAERPLYKDGTCRTKIPEPEES